MLFGNNFVATSCRNECDGAQTDPTTAWLHVGLCFLHDEGVRRAEFSHGDDKVLQCGYHGNICSFTESIKASLTRRSHAGTAVCTDENGATASSTMNDGFSCSQVMMTTSPNGS